MIESQFLAVRRPLFEYASTQLGTWSDPPYQWPPSGTVDIAGTRWTYTKIGNTGYRFESPEHGVVEIIDVLSETADTVDARALATYARSRSLEVPPTRTPPAAPVVARENRDPVEAPARREVPPPSAMSIRDAVRELLAVQKPLLEYAQRELAYWAYPPYQWAQAGTVDIEGTRWSYTKVDLGYRFESDAGVVVSLPAVLELTEKSIVVRSLHEYLVSKNVERVMLDHDETVPTEAELARLLTALVKTRALERTSEHEFRER